MTIYDQVLLVYVNISMYSWLTITVRSGLLVDYWSVYKQLVYIILHLMRMLIFTHKFLSVTICWLQHENVKIQVSDPIKPYASSPKSIVINTSLKVKIEYEIHLVSYTSLAVFRADCVRFNIKSSQIWFCILNVVYGSRAFPQNLLPSTFQTRCINLVSFEQSP